jgi:signal transduction histidine kinase
MKVFPMAYDFKNKRTRTILMESIKEGSFTLLMEDNVDLVSILDRVIGTVRDEIAGRPLELVATIDPLLPRVRADQQRMIQALLNTIGSMCRHTTQGKVMIRAYHALGKIMISVEGGAFRNKLVKPEGLRPEDSTTQIGLALAVALIDAHGGRVWEESELGKNTALFMTLPIYGRN